MRYRYKLEDIQKAFKKEGYRLLSTSYTSPHINLDFECDKGHRGQVTWSSFKYRRSRCSPCDIESKRRNIKPILEKEGYVLLSNNYKWYRSKIDCLCPKGHKIQITWGTFRVGHRCPICNQERIKPSYEEIKSYFEKYHYQLLSTEYVKSSTFLQYKCQRGTRVISGGITFSKDIVVQGVGN
jgi:hypothetical protein